MSTDTPTLQLSDAGLNYGHQQLWSGLDLTIRASEFVAVLGANGSGKTSLFRAILGQQPLTTGTIQVHGSPIRRGDRRIGYVPQDQTGPDSVPIRGQDLVGLGLSGHRFGIPWPSRDRRRAVQTALKDVGGTHLAKRSVDRLSGGERQRLRIAQALVDHPTLLLCDEPLSALDPSRQREVSALLGQARRHSGCAVLIITHDINPVLDHVDRVIYLANGQAKAGTVDDVFTSQTLSAMYDNPVDVIRSHGKIIVVGAETHDPYGDRQGQRGDAHREDSQQDSYRDGSCREGSNRAAFTKQAS